MHDATGSRSGQDSSPIGLETSRLGVSWGRATGIEFYRLVQDTRIRRGTLGSIEEGSVRRANPESPDFGLPEFLSEVEERASGFVALLGRDKRTHMNRKGHPFDWRLCDRARII